VACARSRRRKHRLTTRFEDLAAALRAHASGLLCVQAAVELLIGHQRWLSRDDFVSRFVGLVPDAGDGVPLAMVSWRAAVRALRAGRLPCSDGEGYLLRIAASIAEGVPVNLGQCLSTLDQVSIGLVVEAVRHAAGRRGVLGGLR
jgi:hypothetical protein